MRKSVLLLLLLFCATLRAQEKPDTIRPCSQMFAVGKFVNGKKEGHWDYFYNKALFPSYSGKYHEGKKEGEWVFQFAGVLHYKNDLLDGEVIWYHPGGKSIIEHKRNYKEGRPDGEWRTFDLDGNVTEIRHYDNGIPVGLWETHYEFQTFKGPVNEFGRNGKWQQTSHDTLVGGGTYINGLQEGDWVEVWGVTRYVGRYKGGMRNGLWHEYMYKELYHAAQYKDGLLHGADTSWSYGRITSINHFYEGEYDGSCISFHSNGQIEIKQFHDRLTRTATYSEFDENGKLLVSGKLVVNPDYLIFDKKLNNSCPFLVPLDYEFELMEQGICPNYCNTVPFPDPVVSLDSMARYFQSQKFRDDTTGGRPKYGTPEFVRTGVWTFYYPGAKKKEEGEYLPKAEGTEFFGEITYPKTGWWRVYAADGSLLRDELYENGILVETRDRKK